MRWKVPGDQEHVDNDENENDPFHGEKLHSVKVCKKIDFESKSCKDTPFDDFFASVEGHAKRMDECHSDPKSEHCETALKDKIKLHDPEDEGPDWTIKNCHLLLLAAACEADTGVENLWKKGRSGGRHDHADFGQHLTWHLAGACGEMNAPQLLQPASKQVMVI